MIYVLGLIVMFVTLKLYNKIFLKNTVTWNPKVGYSWLYCLWK